MFCFPLQKRDAVYETGERWNWQFSCRPQESVCVSLPAKSLIRLTCFFSFFANNSDATPHHLLPSPNHVKDLAFKRPGSAASFTWDQVCFSSYADASQSIDRPGRLARSLKERWEVKGEEEKKEEEEEKRKRRSSLFAPPILPPFSSLEPLMS